MRASVKLTSSGGVFIFTETDQIGTEMLYFSSAIQNTLTLINSSSLLSTPSKTCFTSDSKQNSMSNVANTNNEPYLETDPFPVLTLESCDEQILDVNVQAQELMYLLNYLNTQVLCSTPSSGELTLFGLPGWNLYRFSPNLQPKTYNRWP